jgi:hypothetical protein
MNVFCRRYISIGMPESRGTVWHSLIMPFGPDLWLALVLILLTLSALLYLKTKLFHRCGAELEPDFSFLQSVFCVFSALCSQGKTESVVTCKNWKCCKILCWLKAYFQKIIGPVRWNSENALHHSDQKILSFLSSFQYINMKIYSTKILTLVLHGWETCSPTLK